MVANRGRASETIGFSNMSLNLDVHVGPMEHQRNALKFDHLLRFSQEKECSKDMSLYLVMYILKKINVELTAFMDFEKCNNL